VTKSISYRYCMLHPTTRTLVSDNAYGEPLDSELDLS